MSFSRQTAPLIELHSAALDRAMAGIGMAFAVQPNPYPAIEDVLLYASQLGMEHDDFRVLSVLTKWIEVHGSRINVDRLTRLVGACAKHERTRAYWAAVGQWQRADRRFARLASLRPAEDRLDLFGAGTAFQIKRRGEHPWFAGTCLRVASGTLRDRDSDVLSPVQLAKNHPVYRQRVIQGPSYRADMWAVLSLEPSLSASELARRTYGSFATAWEVKRDWELAHSVAA